MLEKEKMLVSCNFFFSYNAYKRILSPSYENWYENQLQFGKELMMDWLYGV